MKTNTEPEASAPEKAAGNQTRAARRKTKPARKATRAKQAAAVRRGSKTVKMLELLKRPSGASLKELMKATSWQPHSVRGFLSGTLGRKMGLRVESSRQEDKERVYRIPSK